MNLNLNEQINEIKRQLIGKTSVIQLERNNNIFSGINTFTNPIKSFLNVKPKYNDKCIGYKISKTICETKVIECGKETHLISLNLPCYGIWMITYRLEMNLTLGFSCLRASKITLNLDSEDSSNLQLINNINIITPQNQSTMTNTDTIIYEVLDDNPVLNLFVTFTYGISSNNGVFTIKQNLSLPNLVATRIA